MRGHFKEVCKRCEAVLTQCRCPSPVKKIIKKRLCGKCRKELEAKQD